jgi:hypothetical protein
MFDYFGSAGLLLAPLAATGGLAAFFASEFQALRDVWRNRDQYTLTIGHASAPAAPSCTESAIREPAQKALSS